MRLQLNRMSRMSVSSSFSHPPHSPTTGARIRRRVHSPATSPSPPHFARRNSLRSSAACSCRNLLLLPEFDKHADCDMQVCRCSAQLTALSGFTFLQELSRLYSMSHALETAAVIRADCLSRNTDLWFQDAQAVQLGDVYQLNRCSLYVGWLQVPQYHSFWKL